MGTTSGNLLYAQSGGVTAVINASAAGVIETARKHKARIGKVYAARNGILGALREELIDTGAESADAIKALRHTPGGAFGSCRVKLKSIEADRAKYERLVAVCKAHDIRYFLYNGGNDSADTTHKVSQISAALGYPLICVGVPKTIDNDLAVTDFCPGFGSVAKYTAISALEASLDVQSMSETSTRAFVLEVMGRHAGWIAAAAGLAERKPGALPLVILFPERAFDQAAFLAEVKRCVASHGYCTVVVSEGVRNGAGQFLSEAGGKDAFGHSQLGGVAPLLARMITTELGYKHHWAVADYLQRSARHIASKLDAEVAYKVGEAAVKAALAGHNAVLPVIRRLANRPYRYEIRNAPLDQIANHEKTMPPDFIRPDGFGITTKARSYLLPLIQGEAYPPYLDGLPDYVRLKCKAVKPTLEPYAG